MYDQSDDCHGKKELRSTKRNLFRGLKYEPQVNDGAKQ